MKRELLILLTLLLTLYGRTQTNQVSTTSDRFANDINTIVENAASTFMKDSSRVGLSIGIIKDGKTYTYYYGTSEKGKHLFPTQKTIYEIGSISKTFTGTLLANAIIDRKVKLNDDIRKYLNGNYPNLEYKGQPIKIVHLVTHTAGLPPFLPNRPDIFQHPMDSVPLLLTAIQKNYTKNKLLIDLHKVRLDSIPGFNYKYSNVDAQLVGFILENVYHKSYAELVKKFITTPLSMVHTEVAIKSNRQGQLAKGYSSTGKLMPYMPPLLAPAGGIYSSVEDMLKYMKFHLNQNNSSASLSHQRVFEDTNNFAEGLFWRMNKTTNGKLKIWHTGGTFGFSSYCVLYPEYNIGIILLSNEMDMDSQGQLVSVADKIYESVFSK